MIFHFITLTDIYIKQWDHQDLVQEEVEAAEGEVLEEGVVEEEGFLLVEGVEGVHPGEEVVVVVEVEDGVAEEEWEEERK